jgi:hypothetical protein
VSAITLGLKMILFLVVNRRFERRERLTERRSASRATCANASVLTDDAERGTRGHRCNDAR